MSAAYNQQQIIFSLSSLVSVPMPTIGTAAELAAYAHTFMAGVLAKPATQALIGEWEIVWGPAVFQAPSLSKTNDNTVFIARDQQNPNALVIAIAGTNFSSPYGLLEEDLKLSPLQVWPFGEHHGVQPKISQGTQTGLNILLGLTSGAVPVTIEQFLLSAVSESQQPLTLTVAGHSLGGTLAPTLALWFADQQGLANQWDPQSRTTIKVVPSAGLSPGNIAWANYYDQRLGANTDRLWNTLDMVPHLWALHTTAEIPRLYAPKIEPSYIIRGLVIAASVNSFSAGLMGQIMKDTPGLPGTVWSPITDALANSNSNALQILWQLLAGFQRGQFIEAIGAQLHWSSNQIADINQALSGLIKLLANLAGVNEVNGVNGQAGLLAADFNDQLHQLLAEVLAKSHWGGMVTSELRDTLFFLVQVIYQHIVAYFTQLDIWPFVAIVFANFLPQSASQAAGQSAVLAPVLVPVASPEQNPEQKE